MAPWVIHLRVAKIVNEYLGVDLETEYYVGVIAPDSGHMPDPFSYVPPKDVSHWKTDTVSFEERLDQNGALFDKYIKNQPDARKKAFYLGYYVHILTDSFFVRDIIHPYISQNGKPFWREHINTIRGGWYELDYRFLEREPGFMPLRLLATVEDFPNIYFDYFGKDDITDRVKGCVKLYSENKSNKSLPLMTLDENGCDKFISYVTDEIINILKSKISA